MSAEGFIFRGLIWFAITSLAMLPYFITLRKYRAAAAAVSPSWGHASVGALLGATHLDDALERMRRSCRKWLFVGVAAYFVCAPLLPWLLNA